MRSSSYPSDAPDEGGDVSSDGGSESHGCNSGTTGGVGDAGGGETGDPGEDGGSGSKPGDSENIEEYKYDPSPPNATRQVQNGRIFSGARRMQARCVTGPKAPDPEEAQLSTAPETDNGVEIARTTCVRDSLVLGNAAVSIPRDSDGFYI